ncbi:MAG: sulfide-dependent adenosine diphosphate thiazole synthase [Methermicoccaceae archaeon]
MGATEITFAKVGEQEVSQAIISSFTKMLEEHVHSDVIIIGAGPSGLMAGKELAASGLKVLIIERNNYLGGGFWMGGYLMNKITVRAPGEEVLDELHIPYEEYMPGLYVADAPHACSKLIAETCESGASILNMTSFDDVVLREGNRVSGVVINWTPVYKLPREVSCVDPIALESEYVIDSTGHEAVVASKLRDHGLLEIPGEGGMWIEQSEELIVKHTGEVYPGLIVTGMAVAAAYSIPRMGPTFSSMLLSGKRAAEIVLENFRD